MLGAMAPRSAKVLTSGVRRRAPVSSLCMQVRLLTASMGRSWVPELPPWEVCLCVNVLLLHILALM